MTRELCEREDELLDALERSYVGHELAAHIDACASCRELHLVAGAVLDERAHAMIEAPVPSAGAMWLRIRVRERHEAEARARQSLLIGQAATLLIGFALVISFFGGDLAVEFRSLVTSIRLSTPLLLALATWIIGAPIAGWVAIRQK